MRFIGQFIQNLVSKFRNDVFLENIADGTVANDKFLGLDSNNKIVKEAITSSSGDIERVTFQTDSGGGSIAEVATGNADFRIVGGTGASVTNSSTTITVASEDSEIDHDSLSNFVAAEHVDWAGASAGTIHSTNIPTLNQDTTGNAATATNLVASTSTAVQLGTVELGHASDTTLSRSAAGTLAVEGKNVRTEDKHLFIKQGSCSGDFGTTETFFPMTGTAEGTSAVGIAIPMIAPVDGKLLKLHWRTNKNHSSQNTTFRLVNWDSNEAFTTGNKSELCAKTVSPSNQNNVTVIDFQSSLDSGTNAFTAGETIGISMQNSSAINSGSTTKYFFTAVFEFDFSSY